MNAFNDKPILNSSYDLLNRKQFSSIIANHLLSPSSKDGLVVSINGKWGSGKTSIANMIKECIQAQKYSDDNNVIPVLINYSPWNLNTQNQTIRQFLNSLSDHFASTRVLKVLKSTLNIVNGVATFVPSLSVKKAIKGISGSLNKYIEAVLKHPSDLEEYKNKVEKHLSKTRLRYIVFIDDLDRLNNKEIKLVIQLIKSICNFSNVTYVLLYDKEIVANAVKEEQSIDGYAYLEKIVQTEYNVPAIRHEIIEDLISKDLIELFGGKNDDSDNKRISEYFNLGMFKQIATIREERRFLNNFRLLFERFYKEIDLADLLAITYLRFVDENLYKLIVKNQQAVLGIKHFSDHTEANKAKDEFIKKVCDTKFDYIDAEYLLSHLFPYLFGAFPEEFGDLYRKGRLCVPRIFHKYIQMDFDGGDMSLEIVNNVLDSKSANVLSDFSKDLNPEQGRHLLHLLSDYCKSLKDKEMFKSILDFLFSNFSSLQYSRPLFIVDKNFYVGSICNSALKNLGTYVAQKMFIETVSKGEDVGALVCLADYIRYADQDRHFDFSVVDEKTKNELFEIIDEKVLAVLDTNIKIDTYSFANIVDHVLLDVPDKLRDLISTKQKDWLTCFIIRSARIGRSYSDDVHFYISYNFDVLNSVIKLDNAGIDVLINETSFNKDKQRLIVFKMQLNGEKPKDKSMVGYSIEDIQAYCSKQSIDFAASDDYEKGDWLAL